MTEFRPHHFLCTVGFEGKGYSPEFVRGYQEIADRLRAEGGDDVELRVTADTDSICAPCPNRRGQLCQDQSKITRLDEAHAKALDLRPGETLTWGEAKRRIRERITQPVFNRICEPCSWKALGICARALEKLHEVNPPA